MNSYKNHHTNPPNKHYYYDNKIIFVVFVVINQINKHTVKTHNHCTYTQIIIKKIYVFSSQSIRMSGNSINFDNKKIKKGDFYKKNKIIFNIDDIDVNKILVSKKEQYGKYNSFKYFTGYNNNDVITPLCLNLSQMVMLMNLMKIKIKIKIK